MKVLITGGNGSIATAISEVLRKGGHLVSNPSRKELDVTKESLVSEYILDFKPDCLINCAGYISADTLIESSTDDFVKHFEVNIFATYLCSKWTARATKHPIIINIGSTSAFEARESWGAYCSSKAALLSLSETLTKEGIECYGLHPAKTDTGMRSKLFPNEDRSLLMNPHRVGEFVLKILNKEFLNGSQIVLKKDHYYVLPSRSKI